MAIGTLAAANAKADDAPTPIAPSNPDTSSETCEKLNATAAQAALEAFSLMEETFADPARCHLSRSLQHAAPSVLSNTHTVTSARSQPHAAGPPIRDTLPY